MDQEIAIDLADFRKGSGARDHIVNLRLIMEISIELPAINLCTLL